MIGLTYESVLNIRRHEQSQLREHLEAEAKNVAIKVAVISGIALQILGLYIYKTMPMKTLNAGFKFIKVPEPRAQTLSIMLNTGGGLAIGALLGLVTWEVGLYFANRKVEAYKVDLFSSKKGEIKEQADLELLMRSSPLKARMDYLSKMNDDQQKSLSRP